MENIQPIFFFTQKKEETKCVTKNQNYDQTENRGKYSKVEKVRAERNYFHKLKRMKIKLL